LEKYITKRWADIYILCLLSPTDAAAINPLRLEQWMFYVLSAKEIDEEFGDQSSISLSVLEEYVTPVWDNQLKSKFLEVANTLS